MNNEREKWIDEVFQDAKGSQRAKPRPELFAKIEAQIKDSEDKVIPMNQWKYAAAAAILILAMNVTALYNFSQSNNRSYGDAITADAYSQPLISTYQIYE